MSVVAEITNPQITQISLIKKERGKLQPSAYWGVLHVIDDRYVRFARS